MIERYDVVVVGAGPAGSTSAKHAAKEGVSVLLVEGERDIGVPVKCGELLPTLDQAKALLPDVRGVERLFDVPRKFVVNRTRFVRFCYPNGEEVEVQFNANILERKMFDRYLAHEAARAGSDIMVSAKATGLTKEGNLSLVTPSGKVEVKSKIVVGADGPSSTMAKAIRLVGKVHPMDVGMGLQYEMTRVETDEDVVDMYFGKNYAPGCYAWIIPKGDGVANVGVSARSPYMEKGLSLFDYLNRFIKKHPVVSNKLRKAVPLALKSGIVPVGGPLKRTFSRNVILVGDAASQTLAHVGGGIPPALVCGKIAGEVAAACVKGSSNLSEYELRWKREIGKVLENSLTLRRLGDVFFKSDRMVTFISRKGWLDKDYLIKFVLCQVDRSTMLVERTLRRLGF